VVCTLLSFLPCPVFHEGIEFRTFHGQLIFMCVEPLEKSSLDLVRPLTVDFSGCECSVAQHLMTEFVAQGDELGCDDYFLRQVWRNENHTFLFGKHQIARENNGLSDTDRYVDAHQHRLPQKRRIPVTHKCIEAFNLFQAFNVARTGIEYNTGS